MTSFSYHLVVICLIIIRQNISQTDGLPDVIKVGGLFGEDNEEQEMVFRMAIERINADPSILPKSTLVAQVERIGKEDSFHADKRVCGLLRNGVAAIFDPLEGSISRHVQSICDALDIPHIITRWDLQVIKDGLSINLYPRPSLLAKAYVDLVKAWSWNRFVILYEDNEGIVRLQDFFKEAQLRNWEIKLYQFEQGKPYRDTFWKIKEENEYNIVLDVKKRNIYNVLKQAQQVGLMTEQHSYLITLLDLHTVDLEDFNYGRTKITSFRIVDSSSLELQSLIDDWPILTARLGYRRTKAPDNSISTESALIYDGVRLLATAIQDLDQSQTVEIQSISCTAGVPWEKGSSLINYMRPITFRGITGLVGFDQSGFRSSVTLDVMTIDLEGSGLQKIGIWSEDSKLDNSLNISNQWISHYTKLTLQNAHLSITTVLSPPYTMVKESSNTKIGNDQFEGFSIDLIQELSKILHFKYEFRLVKDKGYGRPDANGTWNGMIGELIRGEADIAVADLTITSKREAAVDFTHPFMNTGISILYKKPTKKITSLFSFLSPFSNIVWIYVVGAYIGVSSMLFIVGRLSPYEWENPHPCRKNDEVLENGFSLSNSFWFTIGSLMQQGNDLSPKAMSTRTIAGIWYFFTLIMIASYTANLAAFLTVEKIVFPIEDAVGLANQDTIKYGCLQSGSTASFFSESNITTYKKMWKHMSSTPGVLMVSNEEAKQTVERSDGKYAFLMESASIEYTVERDCNLTQIGGLLDSKGYGIATVKDSPVRMPLSQAILQLQESGVLLLLKERWWKQKKGGGQCVEDKKGGGSVTPLKIDNVGGVFVVLLGGLSFSLFVAILEFMWKARNFDVSQETICEEMLNDLKFAFSCQSSSKAAKPRAGTSLDCYKYSDEKGSSLPPQFSTIY
ncbi:glutamate receptor ionotropic, kainate 2-like [Oppia nitens]|uniref:glutamate receptor ionotropic, kainate 2-like n=1 Tax=Oppia nitens TaxID=1686743 RepID=UPI0023DC50BF|nr:glutamate receptor ionotropic, kainate 2-like [Oppia nitens]